MVRLKFSVELKYEVAAPGCDFIFNIHAAHTRRQRVVTEMMEIGQFLLPQVHTDATTGNRYMNIVALRPDGEHGGFTTVPGRRYLYLTASMAEPALADRTML